MAMDPSNPQRGVRRDVADVAQPLDIFERRTGQRHLQDDGRRRKLDQHLAPPGAADRHLRKSGHRGGAEQPQRRVRADSGRLRGSGGRLVPLRRCRPELEAHQQQHGHHATRILLHDVYRGSEGPEYDLPAQRRRLRLPRRGQDADRAASAAWRQPRALDQSEQPADLHRRQRWRRGRNAKWRQDLELRGQPADRAVLSRQSRRSVPVPYLWRAAGSELGRSAERRACRESFRRSGRTYRAAR